MIHLNIFCLPLRQKNQDGMLLAHKYKNMPIVL